jgi:protein SCO1/2
MTQRSHSIALAIGIVIVSIVVGALSARWLLNRNNNGTIELTSGTAITPPRPLPPMQFVDHEQHSFDLSRLKGHWSLMFFGFTNCPDVCPTTLAVLAQVEKQLADLPAREQPQIVLVSVDPERDTPERIASYIRFFSPRFIGATGSEQHIQEFTTAMGIPVAITKSADGSYTVDHSGAIFVIDPNGEWRALFSPPHQAKQIASDYRHLIAGSRS